MTDYEIGRACRIHGTDRGHIAYMLDIDTAQYGKKWHVAYMGQKKRKCSTNYRFGRGGAWHVAWVAKMGKTCSTHHRNVLMLRILNYEDCRWQTDKLGNISVDCVYPGKVGVRGFTTLSVRKHSKLRISRPSPWPTQLSFYSTKDAELDMMANVIVNSWIWTFLRLVINN